MIYDVVVLDMAGTTVVDDGIVEGAFTRALERVNPAEVDRERALDHVRATMGQSKIDVFRALAAEDTAQALNREFEIAYRELVDDGEAAAIPGAEATIRALRTAGLKVVLTTGFARDTADAIIDALGWQDLADLTLTPAEAGRGRPHPDLPVTALLRTGGSSVAALAVVGDTESDAHSGVRAGAGLVVGVLTGAGTEGGLRAAGATGVLESVVQLPGLLGL